MTKEDVMELVILVENYYLRDIKKKVKKYRLVPIMASIFRSRMKYLEDVCRRCRANCEE